MAQPETYNFLESKNGFFKHNNYHIVEANKDKVILSADITEESLNPYDIIHGALIFGLGDTAMGALVREQGDYAVTLNSTINYLKPGKSDSITAISEVIKKGKTIYYLKANIYDADNNLIASMDANYYVISKKEGIQ